MACRGRWRFGDDVPLLAVGSATPVLTFSCFLGDPYAIEDLHISELHVSMFDLI